MKRLLATALSRFIGKHWTRRITARLDAVYSAEPSVLDPALRLAQRRRFTADWE